MTIPTLHDEALSIPLAILPHQSHVRCPEEDWTGVRSAAERRKLQNRINQRIYRQRRAKPKPKSIPATSAHNEESGRSGSTQSSGSSATSATISIHTSSLSEISTTIARFETRALHDRAIGSPRTDQLLTLIQFNVWRALLANTSALSFSTEWLESEEAVSPFVSASTVNDDGKYAHLPTNLRPTAMQKTIEHHPWIDLFPFPQLRDNLLRFADQYDETELCNDLVDFVGLSHDKTGLIVWEQPWDVRGWEVSEGFFYKWAWTLRGCDDLIEATNYWRERRGEERLGVVV